MVFLGLFAGAWHLLFFGVMRPVVAWRGRHHKADPRFRMGHYQATCVDALVCGATSLLTAAVVRDLDVLPSTGPTATGVACAVVVFVVMCVVDLAHTRPRLQRGEPNALLQAPGTRTERAWWGCLSLAAGTGEELTWRVVQPGLLVQLTGSVPLAITVCALTFGIGHIRNGRAWAATTVAFALVFHAMVLGLDGGLYLAMAVHVALNLAMGFWAGHWVASRHGAL